MSVRFWKGEDLCRVLVCRNGLPSSELNGELGSLARLLSVVSTKTDIVACSGCPVDLFRTNDQSPFFTGGVKSCFRFEQVDWPRLMHKLNYSVFGHIDFFSVLTGLVMSLGGSLTTDWIQRSPDLTRVSNLWTF